MNNFENIHVSAQKCLSAGYRGSPNLFGMKQNLTQQLLAVLDQYSSQYWLRKWWEISIGIVLVKQGIALQRPKIGIGILLKKIKRARIGIGILLKK